MGVENDKASADHCTASLLLPVMCRVRHQFLESRASERASERALCACCMCYGFISTASESAKLSFVAVESGREPPVREIRLTMHSVCWSFRFVGRFCARVIGLRFEEPCAQRAVLMWRKYCVQRWKRIPTMGGEGRLVCCLPLSFDHLGWVGCTCMQL